MSFDIQVGQWVVCQHFVTQARTGRGPWTVAKVLQVHEIKLILSASGQVTNAPHRIKYKQYALKNRVIAAFNNAAPGVALLQILAQNEAALERSIASLPVEFARAQEAIISAHTGDDK